MILQETINIRRTATSKIQEVDWNNLPFGKVFTDHMLVMEYADGSWKTPEIIPFAPLEMHPAMSAVHYGQSVFEGLKAYRTVQGDVAVFRPDMNAKRFAESCERLCMPEIEEQLFVDLIQKFVEVESQWIPQKEGYSLYLRPFMFATDDYIGIRPSDTYKFVVFACPVGAYYNEPVNVKIEEHYTRASEGGVGRAKAAGNYASSLYPARQGQKEGYHQMLWTDGKTHEYIEESGTMNVLFVIDGKIITPSEETDTILRGITKRSVIEVAKMWGIPVEERKISIQEIVDAFHQGRLTEAFGAGTAATIAHIAKIGYRNEVMQLPPVENRPISTKIHTFLDDLKAGKEEDSFNWLYKLA